MKEEQIHQQAEKIMAENFKGLTLSLRNAYKALLIKNLRSRYAKEVDANHRIHTDTQSPRNF